MIDRFQLYAPHAEEPGDALAKPGVSKLRCVNGRRGEDGDRLRNFNNAE
jgi:hypothetical protein